MGVDETHDELGGTGVGETTPEKSSTRCQEVDFSHHSGPPTPVFRNGPYLCSTPAEFQRIKIMSKKV